MDHYLSKRYLFIYHYMSKICVIQLFYLQGFLILFSCFGPQIQIVAQRSAKLFINSKNPFLIPFLIPEINFLSHPSRNSNTISDFSFAMNSYGHNYNFQPIKIRISSILLLKNEDEKFSIFRWGRF